MAPLEPSNASATPSSIPLAAADPAVTADAGRRSGGIWSFYRSIWDAVRAQPVQRRLAIAAEVAMIGAWFVLRTRYPIDARPYLAWAIVTAVIALISPLSGLVIVAATGAFWEPVTIGRDLGMRHLLVAVLGVSVAIRLALGGWRRMPWSPSVLLAIVIGTLTAIGVANTYAHLDRLFAEHAARSWLLSIGGAMIVLVVAVWVARSGCRRPLAAAIVGAVIAGVLSLIDHVSPGVISNGPLAWIGFWKDFNGRLGGAVPSPNGMGAILILPTAILTFLGILGRGRPLRRVLFLVVTIPLYIALYVTFSRAALLAIFIIVVVLGWRIRRPLGAAILAAGIVGGIVFLPSYLQLRSQSALEGAVTPGSVLVASDEYRFRAWATAIRMWQDEPVIGHGFLSYRRLGVVYGDPVLGSPHNEWLRLFAEEGTGGGVAGVAFVATTLWWLTRRRDALGGGILAGAAGYFLMASFNNPFLFIQISIVAFVAIGTGLALARSRAADGEAVVVTGSGPATADAGVPVGAVPDVDPPAPEDVDPADTEGDADDGK